MFSHIFLLFLHSLPALCSLFIPPQENNARFIQEGIGSREYIEGSALHWTFENLISPSSEVRTSSCTGGLLGGDGVIPATAAMERTYTNLPDHQYVRISFYIAAIDEWEPTDPITIQVDDKTPFQVLLTFASRYNICGDTGLEVYEMAIGEFAHSESSMTLRFSTSVSSPPFTSTSIGINQFALLFVQRTQPSLAEGINAGVSLQRFAEIGITLSGCPAGCHFCSISDKTQCLRCQSSRAFDGTGCIACPSSCSYCNQFGKCLVCYGGYFRDLDGNCVSSCPSDTFSRDVGGHRYCEKACPTGEYMLWNYTCSTSCEAPLVQRTTANDGDFCDFPCSTVEYLNEDGTCSPSCTGDFAGVKEEGLLYCRVPIVEPETPEPEGPEGPGKPNPQNPSTPTLPASEQEEIKNAVKTGSQIGKAAGIGLSLSNFFNPADPSRILSGSLKQMLEFTRYLNITHSARLAYLFNQSDVSSDSFFPTLEMSETLKAEFNHETLPYMFEKFEVHSSFLLNYWDSLTEYTILLLTLLFVTAVEWNCKWLRNMDKFRGRLRKLKVILVNYIIGNFYEGFGDVIFYSALELRTVKLNNFYDFLSFATPLFCILLGIGIFLLHWKIIRSYQAFKIGSPHKNRLKTLNKKYESVQVLFEEFQDATISQQAYLLILTGRNIIFNLIITLGFETPVVQVWMIIIMHFIVLGYFAVTKPFKSMLNLLQQTLFEVALLSVNLSWLMMCIIDKKDNAQSNLRDNLSEVVIKMNLIYTFIPLAFLAAKAFLAIKEIINFLKERKNKTKIAPLPDHSLIKLNTTVPENPPSKMSFLELLRNEKISRRKIIRRKAKEELPKLEDSNIDSDVDQITIA